MDGTPTIIGKFAEQEAGMCETFTTEEAIRGFKLSLVNARALIGDARALLEARRPHRAISLAALALEELGKCPRYFNVYRFERTGRMKRFWDQYRLHKIKTKMGVAFARRALLPGERTERIFDLWLGSIGSEIHNQKMASFYTDVKDGRFASPLDMSDAEATAIAEELIAVGEKVAQLFHFTATTATVERWKEARRQIDAEEAKYRPGSLREEETEYAAFFVANVMQSPEGYDPNAPIFLEDSTNQ